MAEVAPSWHAALSSSATPEHFTPAEWIERVYAVMCVIDLDPASCAEANENVLASQYYDRATNGLNREWHGRVYVNPPGSCHGDDGRLTTCRRAGKKSCTCKLPKRFWSKLALEVNAGHVTEFVWAAFSISQLRTLQSARGMLEQCMLCVPNTRIKWTGASPTKDNAFLYWGRNDVLFADVFGAHGAIWWPA